MFDTTGIGISSGSQLTQSGIGIPASGFSPVPLVTDKSGIVQLWVGSGKKQTERQSAKLFLQSSELELPHPQCWAKLLLKVTIISYR